MRVVIFLILITAALGIDAKENGDLSLYVGAITSHPFSDGYSVTDYDSPGSYQCEHRSEFDKTCKIVREKIEHSFNESNRLLAIEYKRVFAGYFKNSFNDDSFALGYRFSKQWGNWEGSILAGVTYGYRDCTSSWDQFEDKKVCPAVSPMITYTKYDIKPTLIVIGEAISLTARKDF